MVYSIFEDWIIWSQLESLNLHSCVLWTIKLSVKFSELIGAELDHTYKRESVPHNLFYKCVKL
jgi:hypothetical protein